MEFQLEYIQYNYESRVCTEISWSSYCTIIYTTCTLFIAETIKIVIYIYIFLLYISFMIMVLGHSGDITILIFFSYVYTVVYTV